MTFADALATPGPLLAAFEVPIDREGDVALYALHERPVFLARATFDAGRRKALASDLRARGVRVGAWARHDDHLWCAEERSFTVWSLGHGLELACRDGEIPYRENRETIHAPWVVAIVPYASDDRIFRGVRVETCEGAGEDVVVDESVAAGADPTYNADNLAIDAEWTFHLAKALTAWVDVYKKRVHAELHALGVARESIVVERALMEGGKFSPKRTLDYLRSYAAVYQRELDAAWSFSREWNAPLDDVSDKGDEYHENVRRAREGIELLEKITENVGDSGT